MATAAAASGNIELFDVVVKIFCPFRLGFVPCSLKGQIDHSDCAVWKLGEEGEEVSNEIISQAIKYGHLDMVKYLVQKNYPVYSILQDWSQDLDNPPFLDFDKNNGFMVACRYNRLDILKHLLENHLILAEQKISLPDFDIQDRTIYPSAVQGDSIECVKYLVDQGYVFSPKVCKGAARVGNIKTLDYLVSQGCLLTEETLFTAIKSSQLSIVKHLISIECPINFDQICKNVARYDLEMLKFTHKIGGTLSSKVIESICYLRADDDSNDDTLALSFLKYFHENGGKWKAKVYDKAASYGSVAVLEYLLDNGCPWFEKNIIYGNLNPPMIRLLLDRKLIEIDSFNLSILISSGRPESLRLLHESGFTWKDDTLEDVITKTSIFLPFGGIKYALENGCPWSPSICQHIIKQLEYGKVKQSILLLEYIIERNLPLGDFDFVARAVQFRRVDILKFLLNKGFNISEKAIIRAENMEYVEVLRIFSEAGGKIDKELLESLEMN